RPAERRRPRHPGRRPEPRPDRRAPLPTSRRRVPLPHLRHRHGPRHPPSSGRRLPTGRTMTQSSTIFRANPLPIGGRRTVSQSHVNGSPTQEREAPATVLVVDDDDRLVSSVRRVLAYEGYRVLTATSGPEGLQLARDEAPDLIILDVMLPGLDG